MLSNINHHPRDDHIVFHEPTHTYYIDGSSDGVISVTTFIHKHFPSFNADKVLKNMKNKDIKYNGMTDDQIKAMWAKKGKEASEAGTKMHKSIELFYNQLPYEEFCSDKEGNLSKEFQHFLAFNKSIEHRLKPFRTEWSIFHKDIKLAGQLDMLYEIIDEKSDKKEYALYDWKRVEEISFSNQFSTGLGALSDMDNANYSHYSLQLNTYKRILETYYDIPIKEMFLVVLHPNNETYKLVEVYELPEKINYLFEHRKQNMNKKK